MIYYATTLYDAPEALCFCVARHGFCPVAIFNIIASFGLSDHIYADDFQLYISVSAPESQTAAAQLAALCRMSRSMDAVQQTEIECREDLANLDRNWVTASQADRHSTPADKLSC